MAAFARSSPECLILSEYWLRQTLGVGVRSPSQTATRRGARTAVRPGAGPARVSIWPVGMLDRSALSLVIGTLLGLTVQALSMIPYLREAGFRFRPRFDWRGHGLGKAVKLAKWTVLFVLANQAGVLVVTQLATAAGKVDDCVLK